MATPKEIEHEAWAFFKQVIAGIGKRPPEFSTDGAMARAAGVGETTFNEYKCGTKGHERPSFITVYKLAYVLKGSPPCVLDQQDLLFRRFQEALKIDRFQILSKLITLINEGADVEPLAGSVDVYYQRLFPLEKKFGEAF